jgi:antitoxin component YwqK of YwqJK toxin-antitoxin module
MLFVPIAGNGQQDTVVFTGVNGKLTTEEKADTRKEIFYQGPSKLEIVTCRKMDRKWQVTQDELITKEKGNTFTITNKREKKGTTVVRQYERREDGSFYFREYNGKQLIREGRTLMMFPIILVGECREYYESGQLKSISQYANNELIGNLNWLENGDKYIDSVFYSVDEEPMLTGGNTRLHQHVLQAFRNSGLDLTSVNGTLIVGFVVTETGELKGVRIMKSLNTKLNGIAMMAINSLYGKWKPATLGGSPVRYFQLFPINFIVKEATFQYMEFNGSMIYYNTNW